MKHGLGKFIWFGYKSKYLCAHSKHTQYISSTNTQKSTIIFIVFRFFLYLKGTKKQQKIGKKCCVYINFIKLFYVCTLGKRKWENK